MLKRYGDGVWINLEQVRRLEVYADETGEAKEIHVWYAGVGECHVITMADVVEGLSRELVMLIMTGTPRGG